MGKRKKTKVIQINAWAVAFIAMLIIVGGMVVLMYKGYDISSLSPGQWFTTTPPEEEGNAEYVKLTGVVNDYYTKTALGSASVYILYQDDLLTATTGSDGSFTTTGQIPEGALVTIEIVKSGYLIGYWENIKVPEGDYSFNKEAYLGTFELIDKSSVSINLSDQAGNALTSSYNMTASGSTLQLTIDVVLGEDQNGWGASYRDITKNYTDPKNIYVGGIVLVQLDSSYVAVDSRGSFSKVEGIGTTVYYYMNVGTLLRDDDNGRYGRYSYTIGLTCLGAGSNAIAVKLYNSVSLDDLDNGYFGSYSADATATLDIVT